MSLILVAACDKNRGIGYKNELLCHLREDLKQFKELTEGSFVLMGYNTFKSIGKPLPNRKNIVLTRKHGNKLPSTVFEYSSIDDVLYEYENYAEKEIDIYVIGGSQVYEQMLPHSDEIHLTVIRHEFEKVDSYFPEIDEEEWDKKFIGYQEADEHNDYYHSYTKYTRKQVN
jgi:dihydrofolate reductase